MSEAHDALYSDPKSKEERLRILTDEMKARIDAVKNLTEVQILVRLVQIDPDFKIPRIKALRGIAGWDLLQAKTLVDRFFTPNPKDLDPGAMDRGCTDVLSTSSLYTDRQEWVGSKTFSHHIDRKTREKIQRLEDEVKFLSREVDLAKEDRDRYKNSYNALQDRCEKEETQRQVEKEAREEEARKACEARWKTESEMATQRHAVAEAEHNRREIQYRMVSEAIEYIKQVYKVPCEVMSTITQALA